jgi:hypothetical protein
MTTSVTKREQSGIGATAYIVIAVVVLATGLFWYFQYSSSRQTSTIELSQEAKDYVRSLQLTEVQLKATETYLKQLVVEIVGRITNNGTRGVDQIEVTCVFYDPYGQVVLRQRVPIVSARNGGLKQGESKTFRLPFDNLPDSWNHQLPQLVIAGIQFTR